jgi:antirestriction protein ArdC
MHDSSFKEGPSVYRAITDKIIAAIEAGAGEFVMPWHFCQAITRPVNAATGASYRGVNVVGLWAEAMLSKYETGYWASYRQWQAIGGQVRRGEHGATIVFYRKIEPAGDTQRSLEDDQPDRRFVARASHVFNAEQVDGWSPPVQVLVSEWEACQHAEAFIAATNAEIAHGGEHAFYDIRHDRICLPHRERFIGTPTSSAAESFYSTTLHELVHWSGAAHRLARTYGRFGTAEYAFEELIAELGAAFLCGHLGVSNEPRPDHAAYVGHWLQRLREDSRAILHAASAAEKAVTWLTELAAED